MTARSGRHSTSSSFPCRSVTAPPCSKLSQNTARNGCRRPARQVCADNRLTVVACIGRQVAASAVALSVHLLDLWSRQPRPCCQVSIFKILEPLNLGAELVGQCIANKPSTRLSWKPGPLAAWLSELLVPERHWDRVDVEAMAATVCKGTPA